MILDSEVRLWNEKLKRLGENEKKQTITISIAAGNYDNEIIIDLINQAIQDFRVKHQESSFGFENLAYLQSIENKSKNSYHIYIQMVEKYTKDLKESVYHGAIISALAVGFTMLGKSLIKMSLLSLGKFDVEDGVKLVVIVVISDFTKDYLIKQKIIPDSIQGMATIGIIIGGAFVNGLAFSRSNFLFRQRSKNKSTKNERDTIELWKICKELKYTAD